ncbi:MAG: DUF1588 domain-containing protein [Polyangiaceae bacterium]|nr:DUF1588 domain-containing protein [Polyangiaceae bacterium]
MGLLGLAAAGAIAASGCTGEADGPCVPDEEFFAQKVWAPILSTKCIGCHNPQGLAASSKLVLRGSSEPGFISTNMEIVKYVASFERGGTSQVLLKPSKQIDHGGGQVITADSAEYQALSEMVERFKSPSACQPNPNAFFAGVQLASPSETLRMAALELASRLPTEEEEAAVKEGGMAALDPILDRYMTEQAFFVRVKEIYNDLFLTDRYLNGGEAGTNLLQSEDYDPRWYYGLAQDPSLITYYGAESWDDLIGKLARWTNVGVTREPLELIAHVIKEDRPFTEILTAPYFMVNPFSARAYGAYGAEFQNDADPDEFVEATREGIPHAGVLTSAMWLSRHTTTETNRNRHRARMVMLYFQGLDILRTADQPVDTSKITGFNPTMNNPACTVCHARMDPFAGCFHSFDELGRYDPADTWLEDMRPPGFGDEEVPYEEFPNSLQWLGQRVAADPSFALSTVYTMLAGLTGQQPMLAPVTGEEGFQVRFDAYLAQYYLLNGIARDFRASGYDFKTVVKEIIKSPYFRARNYGGPIDAQREAALSQLKSTRFLTPEQLHRKIWAVTGYPWRPRAFEDYGSPYDYLLRADAYRMLYGGIDSQDVVVRITEPNGIMANISDRMANEISCIAVPRDMRLPAEERLLFPHVELTFEPKDANGFDVVPAIQSIKQNIQFLHKRILGEELSVDDPEIQRTYQLFLETWQEGKSGMLKSEGEEGHISSYLPGACQVHDDYWSRQPLPEGEELAQDDTYVVRAWMSVMSYLVSDFRFLYQ